MQVKVFEAEDMAATLRKVKETLGPDALILSTRTVRKGGLGFLGKPMIEITAAIDTAVGTNWLNTPQRPAANPALRRLPVTVAGDDLTYEKIWPAARPARDPGSLLSTIQVADEQPLQETGVVALRAELDEIKELVKKLAAQIPVSDTTSAAPNTGSHPTPLTTVLAACGIKAEAAATLCRLVSKKLRPDQAPSISAINELLKAAIAELLPVSTPIGPGTDGPRRVALIGPTGVGKTTTIAKLAADHLMKHSNKVALVTIDTYRIAAVEQLKVYGEIMRLPVEVVLAPEQLPEVLARHQDKELILIDTAGRSPRDGAGARELAAYFAQDPGIEKHLVLAANTREQELHETIRRLEGLRLDSIIFTKIDECGSFGALINVPFRDGYPLSYLTNGQRVPEDLLYADPQAIANLIIHKECKGHHDGIDA
ncbi:MAG: flagellar biosynthesis protein FlhF [Deltaproteobacteria bacterium RIFOXYD12_FULL_57_12]|nr:MAG: flagellar biosynthesis protein FlhF [Deltaproteobacteria bacterium RIFOXYD12_FULL_57_12]